MHTFKKTLIHIGIGAALLIANITSGFSTPPLPRFVDPTIFANIAIPNMPLDAYKQGIQTMKSYVNDNDPNLPLNKFLKLWDHNHPPHKAPIHGPWLYEDSDTTVTTTTDTPTAEEISENVQSVSKDAVYVVIDYSNITANLQTSADHPINPKGLHDFLVGNRPCMKKVISATFPSASHPIWKEWEALGYGVRVGGSGKEIFVDDSLHAQIFRELLNQKTPKTLIMVTGDGNSNSNYTSFLECAKIAAEKGWNVEVCSWNKRLNSAYKTLADHNANVTVRSLDRGKFWILRN